MVTAQAVARITQASGARNSGTLEPGTPGKVPGPWPMPGAGALAVHAVGWATKGISGPAQAMRSFNPNKSMC
jgi:hypothetical protein